MQSGHRSERRGLVWGLGEPEEGHGIRWHGGSVFSKARGHSRAPAPTPPQTMGSFGAQPYSPFPTSFLKLLLVNDIPSQQGPHTKPVLSTYDPVVEEPYCITGKKSSLHGRGVPSLPGGFMSPDKSFPSR